MLQPLASKGLHCMVSHHNWQTCKRLLSNDTFLCLDWGWGMYSLKPFIQQI